MRIKDQTQKRKPIISLEKGWRIPVAALVLAAAFLIGYTSHPAWKFDAMIAAIKKALIKTDQAIVEDVRQEVGLYSANGLATLFLDIPFDSLLSIEEKRTQALASGILLTSDEDFVPASMHLNDGDSFPIKLRLKGDWTDHLVGDKWSFRIHIEDSQQAILGMRRFSIQAPETRNYEKEWVYHQNLIKEDILTTRYYFVNVVQNGRYHGIYALEESFTEDLLESQGRREGPIIRFNEDLLWKNWENLGTQDSQIKDTVDSIGEFWLTDAGSSEITAFRQNHLTKDELLAGELFTAIELLHSFDKGLISGEEVFDLDLWGKYFALTDLWGAGHATSWINLRLYFNPITGLLEPVVFDALPFEPSATRDRLAFPFAEQGFIQQVFRIPGVQKSYVSHLERITKNNYLNELESDYGPALMKFHSVLSGYLEKGILGDIPPLPWEDLRLRASVLASNLESPQPVQGNFQITQIDGVETLKINLTNLMVLPVEIQGLTMNDDFVPVDPTWCPPRGCQENLLIDYPPLVIKENTSLTLNIPVTDLVADLSLESAISVTASLYGGNTSTGNPLSTNYQPQGITSGAKPSVTMNYALSTHPYLEQISEDLVKIKPGSWKVKGDLILPENTGLIIPAGVSLYFDSDAILLVNGQLNIAGQINDPVVLSSINSNWGGIVALGDGSIESSWMYATIENTSGIIRGGWVLTGGITFFENDLFLDQVNIHGTMAEDAINIIRGKFNFQNVVFSESTSDAFDGDFSEGIISNCTLKNIAGDGVDFSGSTVTIDHTEFDNIGDKAVSAGEESLVSISESSIQSANIGIASKDLSEVTVDLVSISNAKVAGLAVYIKKPQYGPAYMNADQISFYDTTTDTLCQTGSILILSGTYMPCQEVDVEALYEQDLLGN